MSRWELARSLQRLRGQVDERWPGRSRRSDGTIGDERHRWRTSDHNPWVRYGNIGIVSALDITHDPGHGIDIGQLGEWLRQVRDDRIKYCLVPGTRVLTRGLEYKAIEQLGVGEELIGFDEEGPWKPWHEVSSKQSVMAGQRLRTAKVEGIERLVRPCFEVVTDYGTAVSSSEHRWLGSLSEEVKYRAWLETWTLQPGITVQGLSPAWEEERGFEAGWLSGIFDGEGSLSYAEGTGSWTLGVGQKFGDVLERIIFLLEQYGVKHQVYDNNGALTINIRGGFGEVLRFLGRFPTIRLLEKAVEGRIWEGRSLRGLSSNRVTIQDVRSVGAQEVIALQTSTRTFIAEGLFSHNCISQRRIFSSTQSPWVWRRYTGSNPHETHLHISVKSQRVFYDDDRDWDLWGESGLPASAAVWADADDPGRRPMLGLGSRGEEVKTVQRLLMLALVDGEYGPLTEAAVRAFQRREKLFPIDGVVGPVTWSRLDQIEQLEVPFHYTEPRLLSEPE